MSQSVPAPATAKKPLLSSAKYNVLKHVAMYGLPLVSALYYALSTIWNLPDVAEVLASIVTVNTILGGLLGYSTATYNASEAKYAGMINIVETETGGLTKKLFSLDLGDNAPEDIENMAEATFKVVKSALSEPVSSATPANPGGSSTAHGASV